MKVTMSVSVEELVEIAQLLVRLRKDAKIRASSPTLTAEELELAASRPIEAIKAVHARLGCSLVAAKDIVEEGRNKVQR